MNNEALKARIETQAERIYGSWRGVGKKGVLRLILDGMLFGMELGREQGIEACRMYANDRRRDTREAVAENIRAGIEAAGNQRIGVE